VRTVIYGAGGMGREALAWLRDVDGRADVAGFLDDDPELSGSRVADLAVLGDSEWLEPGVDVVVAVGAPRARRAVVERVLRLGASLRTVVHPSAYVGARTTIGAGSIVCPNVTLTVDITIGDAVIVNYGARIGHDGQVGDYAFVGPGVHLAGAVCVGEGAEVGIGASVIQGIQVGRWSRVGAGAVVVRDVPDDVTAVGVPARPISSAAGEGAS